MRTGGPAGLRWSLRIDGALDGALNMARDHAFAEGVIPGHAVFRLYGWARPTLSFGRNEPSRGMYDLEAAEARGIGFVRRPTGGRAVLHHRELTYAVATPLRSFGTLRDAYHHINRGLTRGLASMGVPAEIAGSRGRAAPPDAGPCFQLPAEGEVMALGRKLVGSAQARIGGALLQHGSILIADDQGLVEELRRRRGPTAPDPAAAQDRAAPPATLHEVLGQEPTMEALTRAVVDGFRAHVGGSWTEGAEAPPAEERRILLERYARDDWTWRA